MVDMVEKLIRNQEMSSLSRLLCSDTGTGPPYAFSSLLTDMKIRVATEYKRVGHTFFEGFL